MQQAFARLVSRVFHGKSPDGIQHDPELSDIICELGHRFTRGAICAMDDENFHRVYEDPYSPYVLPGGRLPHVALTHKGKSLSSLDLIKQNFVLFAVGDSSSWQQASLEQRNSIDFHPIDSTTVLQDKDSAAAKTWKLETGEAILVRPDGIIAWRSGKASVPHSESLRQAIAVILQ